MLPELLITLTLLSSPIAVTTTGDSNTTGYSPVRLQQTFNAGSVESSVTAHAEGGLDTQEWLENGFASAVLADDPDVILYMMGTNDAFGHVENPFVLGSTVQRIGMAFDQLATGPAVPTIATLLPVLNRPIENANVQAINVWLRAESHARGWFLLDVNWFIQQESGWQDFYNDDVHLWATVSGVPAAGYWWLSSLFRDASVHSLLPADGNFDGVVDLGDYTWWGDNFGSSVPNFRTADYNDDGLVDIGDFTLWGEQFGMTVSTPEPSAAEIIGGLLVCAGAYLLIRSAMDRGYRR